LKRKRAQEESDRERPTCRREFARQRDREDHCEHSESGRPNCACRGERQREQRNEKDRDRRRIEVKTLVAKLEARKGELRIKRLATDEVRGRVQIGVDDIRAVIEAERRLQDKQEESE